MKHFTVTELTYTPGPYGPVQHASLAVFRSAAWVRKNVKNARDVLKINGARCVVIDKAAAVAVQVGGYNDSRGLFSDVFAPSKLAPYMRKGRVSE